MCSLAVPSSLVFHTRLLDCRSWTSSHVHWTPRAHAVRRPEHSTCLINAGGRDFLKYDFPHLLLSTVRTQRQRCWLVQGRLTLAISGNIHSDIGPVSLTSDLSPIHSIKVNYKHEHLLWSLTWLPYRILASYTCLWPLLICGPLSFPFWNSGSCSPT